jgi:hypothetical protein
VTLTLAGRHRSNRSRAAAHTARWPPAECPRVITFVVSMPATSARASRAAAMSSSVCGTPPPLPTRRYSTLAAVQPSSRRLAASGRPRDASYCAFQKPPWMTTTVPREVLSGREISTYWLGSSP